jgi:hypothetical protein
LHHIKSHKLLQILISLSRLCLLGLLFCIATTFNAQSWKAPTIRQFTGVNILAQEDCSKAHFFSTAREFHLWTDDAGVPLEPVAPDCPFDENYSGIKLRWNPSYNGNKLIKYNDLYSELKGKVSPILFGAPPIMNGGSVKTFLPGVYQKPICHETGKWADLSWQNRPEAYKEHTIWQSLFVAKFGKMPAGGWSQNWKNKFAQHIDPQDTASMGQGFLAAVENWNEHEAAWWDNLNVNGMDIMRPGLTKWYFSPSQYAAMLSANYDGHQRSPAFAVPDVPGAFWGVQNMSPGIPMVLSATCDIRRAYWQKVMDQFADRNSPAYRENRSDSPRYPFDVVNFHQYASEAHPPVYDATGNYTPEFLRFFDGAWYFTPFNNRGIHPEAARFDLKTRLRVVLEAFGPRSKYDLSSKQFWLSEFGYDTHADPNNTSGVETHPIGPYDRQSVQGQWLVRSILEMAAARGGGRGFDKVMIYTLQDNPAYADGQFSRTGLVDVEGHPKKSWYHVMTLLNTLGDYQIQPEKTNAQFYSDGNTLALGANTLRCYRFEQEKNGKVAYALWSPTASNAQFSGRLRIAGTDTRDIVKVEVNELDENGIRTRIPAQDIEVSNGFLTIKNLRIGETPVYLLLNNTEPADTLPQFVSNMRLSNAGCNGARLRWDTPTRAPQYYRIYAAPLADFGNKRPTLDLSIVKTIFESIPGNAHTCLINGLKTGIKYVFFVLPVGGTPENPVAVQYPAITQADVHYLTGSVSGCSGAAECLSNLEGNAKINTTQPIQNQVHETLGIGKTSSEKCAEMSQNELRGGWEIYTNYPHKRFSIQFNQPKRIEGLYLHQSVGRGRLQIEVMTEGTDQWQSVQEIELATYNGWIHADATPLSRLQISRIRFTVHVVQGQDVRLSRIYFLDGEE